MSKILCVLYPDPVSGFPPVYARDDVPEINVYPNGQTAPTPNGELGFKPGELIGSVSGELGLRKYLESQGHELIVTSDKDGADSMFDRHLPDADVVISQPFWPAYLTPERIAKAKKLKLALTAGIGSDHVDLKAAAEHGITVAEVTFSNSISVAEHAVMTALALVRLTPLVVRSVTVMRLSVRWSLASWQVTVVTSGSHNPRRLTIHGVVCQIRA